ncbi:hypothetical protein AGOR_G00252950 [Albula goreensis]|uniref:Ig-like domain-containing protein n=1 Tax=Albula goreensis TaxID=1534307 RepID=A0A8T3CGK7_9TELE|nr:hypothetical protein AGOR_G00252950 [Albula goreensis]
MQWSENNKVIIQSSEKGMKLRERAFTGRVTMSNETGDLTISCLREEDSGKYVFSGFGSSGAFNPKEVELHVYERISKVQVDSQVKNSTNSSSCSVTLSCSVLGGSQVALSWSSDGQRITEAENRTTLTVSPSREQNYSCTASNPVSSLTGRVTVTPCQTHGDSAVGIEKYLIYIYAAASGGFFLLLIMTVAVCIKKKCKRGKTEEDITFYAEVGENLSIQKGPECNEPSPIGNVSTCYDVIKGKGNGTTPPTVYDTVKFDRATANTQYQDVL